MLKFESLRSTNSLLNFCLKFVNLVIHLIFGILNLFCEIGIYFYNKLIKKYKYESLYIIVISVISLLFIVSLMNGKQEGQLVTMLGNKNSILYILLLVISIIFILIGCVIFFINIIKKNTLDKKYFWPVRIISYLATSLLLLLITEFIILDFVSVYKIVKKPTSESSSYEVIVYFIKEYKEGFASGIKVTLQLALFGTIAGLVLALGMVVLRTLNIEKTDNDLVKFFKKIGSTFANIYVTVIRGTPMVVQAFVFYYLIASIVKDNVSIEEYREFITNIWTPFRAGLFTVSINTTAYLTEVLRGGINSVDKGQKEAAYALGFGKVRTMLLIIFPQAIKNSLPSIGNEFIINIKDTSVLTMIGIMDLFSVSKMDILGKHSTKNLEAYLIVAVFYLILTFVTSKLLAYIERKMDMPVKGITSSN